jgi:hypothetical protein
LCDIAKHKEEEQDNEARKDDNNQHDDVIFWFNAPLGRERKGGRKWEKERHFTLVIRYNINSNVIVE